MVRIKPSYRIQVCSAKMRAHGELPSDPLQTGTTGARSYAKSPSQFIVAARAQASRRCETQAPLSGKPLALLPFRSLDPFRAYREPDRRRRDEERGFPAPNKEPPTNQKHDLTGKAPYRFESAFLQWRVCCEPILPPGRKAPGVSGNSRGRGCSRGSAAAARRRRRGHARGGSSGWRQPSCRSGCRAPAPERRRRQLWLPIPLTRCDFGLETGRDLAKTGLYV